MKFKVDENLPEELAQLLREAGWSAFSVVEQQLGGEDDSRIAAICEAEDRILITFDRGFANIRSYPLTRYPGMIVFRLKSQDKQLVLTVAGRLVQALRQREFRNELWIVHENRIRVRSI
jgi:predicted nuclease of predicted toxin-antitoxin system